MFSRRKQDAFNLADLRFCGGSEMIVGDENIFYITVALMLAVKGVEDTPIRKRSIFQNHMLFEWKRLLEKNADWMQRMEEFNKL